MIGRKACSPKTNSVVLYLFCTGALKSISYSSPIMHEYTRGQRGELGHRRQRLKNGITSM